jgi:hypothetical protein
MNEQPVEWLAKLELDACNIVVMFPLQTVEVIRV